MRGLRVLLAVAGFAPLSSCEDRACIVAHLGEGAIDVASARRVTASVMPSPPPRERLRLAIDLEVAHRARGGEASATPEEKLQSYRAFLDDQPRDLDAVPAARLARERMEAARRAQQVRPGPCHPDTH